MFALAHWQFHKEISAGKITRVDMARRADGPQNTVLIAVLNADDKEESLDISADVFKRSVPEVDDYLVIYTDGYQSW